MSVELICLFDSDLTLIRVNHVWPRIFGVAEDVAAGRSFLEFIPDQEHHQITTDLAKLGFEMRTTSFNHAVGLKSHVTARVEWRYRILIDGDGAILAYEAVGALEGHKVA